MSAQTTPEQEKTPARTPSITVGPKAVDAIARRVAPAGATRSDVQ